MAQNRKRQPVRFDSLRAAQDLGKTGMPREQAAGVVNMVVEVINDNLATKEDVERIESDVEALKSDVKGIRLDMKEMEIRIGDRIGSSIKWMTGAQFTAAALIIAFLEYLG